MTKIDFDKYNKLTEQYAGGQCLKGYVEIGLKLLKEKKGKILDLGCGTGDWSKVLSDMGFDVHGVDIDLSKLKIKNKKFKVGDMHQLPFEDNYFDYIFNSGVFEHSLSPYIALSEMHRVLKKDGEILLIVPTEKNERLIYLDQHINVLNLSALNNLLVKIGLKIEKKLETKGTEGLHYIFLLKKIGKSSIKKTSIIILAHKEPEKFKKMFEELIKHTHQWDTPYGIIIIGNNPDKRIHKFLIENCDNIHIYNISTQNIGTSKGFNYGAKIATGHYLCFFNSDYYMADNWLKNMIECFEHKPNIGLCSCSTNISGNVDERLKIKIINDHKIGYLKNNYKESNCAIAQMFTTKKIWEEVEGFDEQFYPVTFEDLDFNEKIKKKGYKIFVNRKCFGYHDHDSFNDVQRKEIMDRNRKLFIKKWGKKHKWA